jgi:predicted Rossmann fold flavoprotein
MASNVVLDVVVVGGGAAGFFAAIACAEKNPATRVTLLERSSSVLAKVKVSGGGRCNVTHACFDPARLVQFYPRGGQALRGPFSRFQPRDTMEWFESRGVRLKTEADGRVFPVSDDSQTILDCLITQAQRARVAVLLNVNVKTIKKSPEGAFSIELASGETWTGRRLILATGSSPLGWECAQKLGHTIEPPVPSLFTFTIHDKRLEGLSGVTLAQARVSIEGGDMAQEGPLLITHTGISGPAVLKLSAWSARLFYAKNYQTQIRIQWDAALTADQWTQALRQLRTDSPKKMVAVASGPIRLPQRLWARLVAAAQIPAGTRWSDLSNAHLLRLTQELDAGLYAMRGKSAFKEEFVTCGGVRLKEVDFRTMESKLCKNLFFAGEALDVDAVTGGFNFQNAWTTGWLAGQAAAT